MAQQNMPYSSSLGFLSLALPNMLSRLGDLGGGLLESGKMAGGTIDEGTIPLTNFIFNQNRPVRNKFVPNDGKLSSQAIDEINNLGLLAGGTAYTGSGLLGTPKNSIGMFAGSRAKTYPPNLKNLDKVDDLIKTEQQIIDDYKIWSDVDKPLNQIAKPSSEIKLLMDKSDNLRLSLTKDTLEKQKEVQGLLEESKDWRGYTNQKEFFDKTNEKYGVGLFQLPDEKIRFEIPDEKSVLNLKTVKDMAFESTVLADDINYKIAQQPLKNILKHDELYKAYPDAKDIKVDFYNDVNASHKGMYDPSRKTISINTPYFYYKMGKNEKGQEIVKASSTGEKYAVNNNEIKKTLLHEIQHWIQDKEGFASGTNTSVNAIKHTLKKHKSFLSDIQSNNTDDYLDYKQIKKQLTPLYQADYLAKLKDLATRDYGLQPRLLFNQSDWYEYGSEIINKLGKFPKRKSVERDRWMNKAFQYIHDQNLKKYNLEFEEKYGKIPDLYRPKNVEQTLSNYKDRKQIQSQIKKLERKANPKIVGYQNFNEAIKKDKKAGDLLNKVDIYEKAGAKGLLFDVYKDSLGEVEARAITARMGNDPRLTTVESPFKKTKYPFEQINRGLIDYPIERGYGGLLDTFVDTPLQHPPKNKNMLQIY